MKRPGCKSCGAAVRWLKATTGARVPLDPSPSPLGNVWINPETGLAHFLSKEQAERGRAKGELLYRVHHSTCPSVERHRGISRAQTSLDVFGDAA